MFLVSYLFSYVFLETAENTPAKEQEVSPNNREAMVPIKKRRVATDEHEENEKKEVIIIEENKLVDLELYSKSLRLINLQHLVIQKLTDEEQVTKSHSKRKPFIVDSNELAKLDELDYKKMLHNSLKSNGHSGLKFV